MNIKTQQEIEIMKQGGKILAKILDELKKTVRADVTTNELNKKAEDLMNSFSVTASFKGYRNFPASICTNINNEVVHSIPNQRKLQNGDIISIDCGVIFKEMHTDAAITVFVGNVDPKIAAFVKTVEKALYAGIKQAKPGNHIGDIGETIQGIVEKAGYSIIKDYIGHGVGYSLHEFPEVPNFGKRGQGPALVPGMTLAIEPICAMKGRFTNTLKDGWTVVTRDSSPAVQIEHTILITNKDCEILTSLSV